MSDVLTHFKVTEKALLVQAVAFNEWSLLMIDQMIAEREASLMETSKRRRKNFVPERALAATSDTTKSNAARRLAPALKLLMSRRRNIG